MFISGIFNDEMTSPSHRARIPATFAIMVNNSQPIGVLMDVRSGSYHRRGYLTESLTSWYELRWYAHRSERSLYVLELDVHNEYNQDLTINLVNTVPLFQSTDFTFNTQQRKKVLNTEASSICGTTKIPETSNGPRHTVCITADTVPNQIIIKATEKVVTYNFLSAYRTSLDITTTTTEEAIQQASMEEYNKGKTLYENGQLYLTHIQAWDLLWQSGIEINGRPDVAIAVNASFYAILSSIRSDWAYGLAPGGLTNYYNGHSFWDTETWMYPPLLMLHPDISQSLLQYRFNRIDGAKLKAQSYTPPFSGTMFPWESAYSGVETCPSWAATGSREDHISGDISIAIWQEWLMRQDINWLKSIGYPMLQGIADFWVSRSTYKTNSDGTVTAHILDIIPPDEYVDHVNDSVYSNFVAAQALRSFVSASQLLQIPIDTKYAKLADDLVILYDETLQIHPEYDGYPGNTVKQADVVLLHYPLNMPMSEELQRKDLEYYSVRTDIHGPAMTWGMHAIGYLDLQDYNNAAKYFNMSFQDNMHDPLKVWTETVSKL
jgi:protein-glucosylgalactosylhydroxylysine glucosidase